MTPEAFQKMQEKQIAVLRLDYLVRTAWHSIAKERGYLFDAFLGTSSHETLAIRSHLFANGV